MIDAKPDAGRRQRKSSFSISLMALQALRLVFLSQGMPHHTWTIFTFSDEAYRII